MPRAPGTDWAAVRESWVGMAAQGMAAQSTERLGRQTGLLGRANSVPGLEATGSHRKVLEPGEN